VTVRYPTQALLAMVAEMTIPMGLDVGPGHRTPERLRDGGGDGSPRGSVPVPGPGSTSPKGHGAEPLSRRRLWARWCYSAAAAAPTQLRVSVECRRPSTCRRQSMPFVVVRWPSWIAGRSTSAHIRLGQGLFVAALRRQLAKQGVTVRFGEYDFAARSQPA
jgi:hypothetical protein